MDGSKEQVPTLSWRRGWRLQASPLHARAWEGSRWGVRTLERPGDLASCNPAAAWTFRIGLAEPDDVTCEMISSGFRLATARGGFDKGVTLIAIAPDTYYGEARCAATPILAVEGDAKRDGDGSFWVDDPEEPAYLAVDRQPERTRFCLLTGIRSQGDAKAQANHVLEQDHDGTWELMIDRRRPFWARQDPLAGSRGLLTYAFESLHAHLVPGQGIMPDLWSASALPLPPHFNLRHLFPLVAAWREIDGAVARALLETVVGMIGDDGSLPAAIHPDGLTELNHAPLPLICQSMRLLWEVDHDRDIIFRLLPRVELYLRWIIRHVDPEDTGHPAWQCAEEAWIRDTYDKDLSSADLATMLLGEIDAFHELADTLPAGVLELQRFPEDYAGIADHLRNFLWNEESKCYRDRYRDGRPIARITLSSVTPIAWARLPQQRREALLAQIRNPHFFFTPRGLTLWVRWENDAADPPAPAMHQAFLLDALARCKAEDDLARLKQTLGDRLTSDFRKHGRLVDDAAETDTESLASSTIPLVPHPIAAAMGVLVWATPRPHAMDIREFPSTLAWVEKHRRGLIIALSSIILLLVLAGVSYSLLKRSLNTAGAETTVGMASRLYQEAKYDDALRMLREMEETSGSRYTIEFLIGNVYFRKGLYTEAETYYRRSLERSPDNPRAAMNLALSLYRQNRFEDSLAAYEKVITDFEFSYPDLVGRARAAVDVLREQAMYHASHKAVAQASDDPLLEPESASDGKE